MMQSLDGYISDSNGQIDWVDVDEEIHAFANDEARKGSVDIYGRRMYETMAVWETLADEPGAKDVEKDFARQWKSIEKIVISTTLADVSTSRTRLLRSVDQAAIRDLKESSAGTVSVSGPTLASAFLSAGLIDEVGAYVMPVVLGDGKPFLPGSFAPLRLELTEEHRFSSGAVFLRYSVRR